MGTNNMNQQSIDRFFCKLEQYFPEHKVFALDSIDKELREKLTKLYKATGFSTDSQFLQAYGYRIIAGEDVKKIRSSVIYTPGNEPDIIRNKVNNMLSKLHEYYPDLKITRGIQNDHKNLSSTVSGLYQWLGYEDAKSMLKAYGFEVEYGESGRPSYDYDSLIVYFQEKYKDKQKPKSIAVLTDENKEFAGKIKSLNNKSNELFGMSLAEKFRELGILEPKEIKLSTEKIVLCNYFKAEINESKETVFCATDTRMIHEGFFVEMNDPTSDEKLIGRVIQTYYLIPESELPCSLSQMKQLSRRVFPSELRDIEASKIKYIFCSVQIKNRGNFYYLSDFENIEVGDIVTVNYRWDGEVDGIVRDVIYASEKTAPYPVKKTKPILSIKKKISEEREKINQELSEIIKRNTTKVFTPVEPDRNTVEKYEQCTYFASAVFRGFEADVRLALREIYPNDFTVDKYIKKLQYGVCQFECDNSLVMKIIKEYPRLKCIFFAEYWNEEEVYLAYSESGYDTVTDMRFIGKCKMYQRDRFGIIHDPTEDNFSFETGKYEFTEKDKWQKLDYVLPDGNVQLVSDSVIPSCPYKKRATYSPCGIIKIVYPEQEAFYVPPQPGQEQLQRGDCNAEIKGKTFVIAGELTRFSCRGEFEELLRLSGVNITENPSTNTTALITNNPNSKLKKIQKAIDLGIDIISEDEFIEKYMCM